MKKLMALGLSVAVVAVAAVAVAVAGNNPQKNDVLFANCVNSMGQKQGVFKYDGPVVAWPPNHKYRTAVITLTEDSDADPMDGVAVSVTGKHDQMVDDTTEMNGAGNTDPATDVVPGAPGTGTAGSASTSVQFRGERSGRDKNGRTYTFTVNGSTDSGAPTGVCQPVEFKAVVPHDQRKP